MVFGVFMEGQGRPGELSPVPAARNHAQPSCPVDRGYHAANVYVNADEIKWCPERQTILRCDVMPPQWPLFSVLVFLEQRRQMVRRFEDDRPLGRG